MALFTFDLSLLKNVWLSSPLGFGVLVFIIVRGRTHWQWRRRFWSQADMTHRVWNVFVSNGHFGGNEETLWRSNDTWRAGIDLRHLSVGVVGHVHAVDGDCHGRADFEDRGGGRGEVRGRRGRSHSRMADGLVLPRSDGGYADGRNLKSSIQFSRLIKGLN